MKKAPEEDSILTQVLQKIKDGWPRNKSQLPKELQPLSVNCRVQLTMQGGCILCGLKVVIPTSLRERVLEEIHTGYTGIVEMKSVAKMHVWWPQIDSDIEETVSGCAQCQENSKDPAKAPVHH